jgi:hypothetical protein
MAFTITHVSGAMESNPPSDALAALVAELAEADAEHPDVAVADESGWTLSASLSGRVVWENVDEDAIEPRHLEGISARTVLELFERLAAGDIAEVESQQWLAGY